MREGVHLKQVALLYTTIYHIKKVRHLSVLCNILFCTDDRCSLPLHTLVADVVDSQGGSVLLIKTLNRLGLSTSSDTLNHFIQYKVSSDHAGKSVQWNDQDSFVVVSAGDIDFLHGYARVFQGNQTSS